MFEKKNKIKNCYYDKLKKIAILIFNNNHYLILVKPRSSTHSPALVNTLLDKPQTSIHSHASTHSLLTRRQISIHSYLPAFSLFGKHLTSIRSHITGIDAQSLSQALVLNSTSHAGISIQSPCQVPTLISPEFPLFLCQPKWLIHQSLHNLRKEEAWKRSW